MFILLQTEVMLCNIKLFVYVYKLKHDAIKVQISIVHSVIVNCTQFYNDLFENNSLFNLIATVPRSELKMIFFSNFPFIKLHIFFLFICP